jgi:hypothetical protein
MALRTEVEEEQGGSQYAKHKVHFAAGEKMITHDRNQHRPPTAVVLCEPSGKVKGGNGIVAVPPSFCKCSNTIKPIPHSEIPLRALLLCALCVKREQVQIR